MALRTVDVPPLDPYGFTGPTRTMAGIGRSNNVILNEPYREFARWLYVGTGGDIALIKWDGQLQQYRNVAAGLYPFCSIMIQAAGTTAGDLVWGS